MEQKEKKKCTVIAAHKTTECLCTNNVDKAKLAQSKQQKHDILSNDKRVKK